MNNVINNRINFGAGFDDPTRTIKKKYSDYKSVEKEINRYNALNKELLDQIQALQTEKAFLIQSYQNNPFRSEREVCDKINVLTMAIDDFKQQIEVNKSRSAALWYGYHERL